MSIQKSSVATRNPQAKTRDGGAFISLDDFDIDYLVLSSPINDGISVTLQECALRKKEEGRVLQLNHVLKYQAAKKVLEGSRRAALLSRVRLEQSSSNSDSHISGTIKNINKARIVGRQSLPLTAYEEI